MSMGGSHRHVGALSSSCGITLRSVVAIDDRKRCCLSNLFSPGAGAFKAESRWPSGHRQPVSGHAGPGRPVAFSSVRCARRTH